MSFEEISFKVSWFAKQKDNLEEAYDDLYCIKEKIQSVRYDWNQSDTLLPFKEGYDEIICAITGELDFTPYVGAQGGLMLIKRLSEGMRQTGVEYLRTEAKNEGYAREIERLIEESGL